MTQSRYTIQQHNINFKSPAKLSHMNMYHCESPAPNISPGHPYSKIIYIQKGNGQFLFDNQYIPVETNDLIIVNPDRKKFSVEVQNGPLDFTILGIENLYFSGKQKDSIAPFTKLYFSTNTYRLLMDMIIQEVTRQSEGYEEACSHYVNLLLIEIERDTEISHHSLSKEKSNKDCTFIKDYLDEHYTENITLDILSEKSNMNKYYLVHSFTKNFGCSPINYLNEKRIEESKNLLETTNHSIADIASMIGFSSQSYFSQSFKKNTFMTPNEYRRSVRQI
ncbi:MAG: AraC family transcriptional regulator [Eubacterium sp.]|nr:AraC family transcriptional regulator [Eubacterium sp.]MDD7210299.1 AraC family transcriptional regulator [Lachnospiraceae bacterium]MDY5496853.1 AraC family transcriptional regulator [Anaerobutyricum sp.]